MTARLESFSVVLIHRALSVALRFPDGRLRRFIGVYGPQQERPFAALMDAIQEKIGPHDDGVVAGDFNKVLTPEMRRTSDGRPHRLTAGDRRLREFAGLEAAGWCEEEEGKLRLTLVLVNIGSGRRGGVRLRAPHSAGWEAAGALALAEPAVPQDHSVATEQCVTLAT